MLALLAASTNKVIPPPSEELLRTDAKRTDRTSRGSTKRRCLWLERPVAWSETLRTY